MNAKFKKLIIDLARDIKANKERRGNFKLFYFDAEEASWKDYAEAEYISELLTQISDQMNDDQDMAARYSAEVKKIAAKIDNVSLSNLCHYLEDWDFDLAGEQGSAFYQEIVEANPELKFLFGWAAAAPIHVAFAVVEA